MYRFLGSIHGGNTVENIRSNFSYKIAHNLRLCTTTINSVVVLHFGLSYCISVPLSTCTCTTIVQVQPSTNFGCVACVGMQI